MSVYLAREYSLACCMIGTSLLKNNAAAQYT